MTGTAYSLQEELVGSWSKDRVDGFLALLCCRVLASLLELLERDKVSSLVDRGEPRNTAKNRAKKYMG